MADIHCRVQLEKWLGEFETLFTCPDSFDVKSEPYLSIYRLCWATYQAVPGFTCWHAHCLALTWVYEYKEKHSDVYIAMNDIHTIITVYFAELEMEMFAEMQTPVFMKNHMIYFMMIHYKNKFV